MTHFSRFIAIGAVIVLLDGTAGAEAPDFGREVRPILADACFQCHGPDPSHRKADLRLDLFDSATAENAVVPGDPAASEVIRRILSDDPDERMPPPDEAVQLSGEQIQTLRAWIAAGADYEKHWAFEPIDAPVVPGVSDQGRWMRNPVDAFILARLRAEGLEPAPQADPETLLRRVTLDLTGLPPTVAEMDAFLADASDAAYDAVVDRLLASPAYGEHMARAWLDAARYADTYGYQADRENYVWPWREWVIRAFNDNLPYDAFLTWQIAGDLLPNAAQDQRLATAFNRLHRQTNEGGSTLEEFRVAYVTDRTETFSTAMLGLTMQCARCHDHKFDPISQREYYELFSFFDDIDESGMYSHFTDPIPTPALWLYKEGEKERHEDLRAAIAFKEDALRKAVRGYEASYKDWLADDARPVVIPVPVVDLSLDTIEEGKVTNRADTENPGAVSMTPEAMPGKVGGALQFDGDNGVSVSKAGIFERTDPFSIAMWIRADELAPHAVVCHHTKAAEDAASRGYEVLLEDGHVVFSIVHFWPGDAIRVQTLEPILAGEWVHVTTTYDGSSRAEGVKVYLDGAEAATEVIRDEVRKTIRYDGGDADEPPLTLASRFRDTGFKGGAIDEFQIFDVALTLLEVQHVRGQTALTTVVSNLAHMAGNGQTFPPVVPLLEYYISRIDADVQDALESLQRAREREQNFVQGLGAIMAMEALPEPRQAYVLARGAYDQPTDPVEPGTPQAALAFDGLPPNRLGLAQWLTGPDNPLTGRVAVNRLWQAAFGRGIVATPEDFGTQGAAPTHPELLDWLATQFIADGWDTKALLKLLVTSAAYRQDSACPPALRERDPQNSLLARGPQRRLSAEQVRDSALAASGLLVEKIGGPSVKPWQPPGLWEAVSGASYAVSEGEGRYRRSLYTFWKRTMPPPNMMTFDAVDRESCVMRREVTATPLQALVLLNDPQFVEAARVLAESVVAETDAAARIDAIFRRLVGRHPSAEEAAILQAAWDEQAAWFAEHPEDAAKYAVAGDARPREGLDPVATATATALAQAIMNFEEFQVKQ